MSEFKVVTSDTVLLQISASKQDLIFSEKKFPKNLLISSLKSKLELITGANAQTMKLEIYSKDNDLVCMLSNDEAMLGSYPVEDEMRLHVVDKFAIYQEFGDLSNVQKFELSDEAYDQKENTVKQYLAKNKMGHYNEDFQRKKEIQQEKEKELTLKVTVGSRCKVTVINAPTRLGTVMYKGEVDGLNGHWVGVKYDEPLGKNDGSFKGKQYFQCAQNYGAFVKAINVELGDFPQEDYDLDDEF